MKEQELIAELTTEEKIALLAGTDFMYTNPVPRLGIPSIRMSDGPHGLRVQKAGGDNGVTGSEAATAFPTAATMASGWNPENTFRAGQAIAEEALHYGVDVVLGPGACIKRNPLCGRNFEYFSEDPYLAGKLAAAEVRGLQSKNVGASVKHFALNNAENYRFMGNSVCDMRAIREIYLKVFEIIVRESRPHTVMCAYNRINGTYCCENQWLLTDVLRREWGFDGAVISDWGATHDRVKGVAAGLDVEMPGDTAICRKWLADAMEQGTLPKEALDTAAERVVRLVSRYRDNPKGGEVDWSAHDALSASIAEDCAVLLKNDGMLPLREGGRLLVVGDLFEKMRYQGAGSSMICPTALTTPKTAFDRKGVPYTFCRGYAENETTPDANLIAEALSAASDCDRILLFAGLTDYVESEGCDRADMRLPDNQLALIDALTGTGKQIAVVLFGGSPVEVPFEERINALLDMYLPGQNGGTAVYDLLFGLKSPSGKLAETWVKFYADVPFGEDFSKTPNEVYRESVYVGYRYYLTADHEVRYPFGYGLSYTSFAYRDVQVRDDGEKLTVTCEVTNTGACDGAEVVQLYVRAPRSEVFKPERELRAFAKVYLKPGESGRAELCFDKSDLRYWNLSENRWVMEDGTYELLVCSDCRTVRLQASVTLTGEEVQTPYPPDVREVYGTAALGKATDGLFERMSGLEVPVLPPKRPITLESRFTDLQETFMGRILYRAVLSVAHKDMKQAKKLPAGTERDNRVKGAMFLERILQSNSVITMSMSGSKGFPYNFAQGFAEFANGHIFKGIKCFCTKIVAPKLPKDKEAT